MSVMSAGADVFCSLLSIILYSVNQYCDNMQYFLTRNALFRIQGSQSEPLRRVRVARKATPSFPHACALFDTVGDPLPPLNEVCYKLAACRGGSPPTCVNCKERKIITRLC